jgi:hypothetical protein
MNLSHDDDLCKLNSANDKIAGLIKILPYV